MKTVLGFIVFCAVFSSALHAEDLQVSGLVEETGAIAYAGQAALEGMKIAVDEVNASGRLGDYKLVLDIKDAASAPATSAAMTAEIAQSDSLAVLGPLLSNDALAVAPIAQRARLPMVAIQANTHGLIETGDYIYRLTAPFFSFNGLTIEYLAAQGVKTMALSYPTDISSTAELSKVYIPKWADAAGIKIVGSEGSPRTTTDFSAVVSQLAALNPDAIGLMNLDTQLPALIGGLRRAGYKGYIFTHYISSSTVQAIGEPADGILNSLDYSDVMDDASSAKFTKLFEDKTGKVPTNYDANGYDAVMFVTAALEKVIASGAKPDRESLLKGMQEVALHSFDAASGTITFDQQFHRDARVPGVLIAYKGGKPQIIARGVPGKEEQ